MSQAGHPKCHRVWGEAFLRTSEGRMEAGPSKLFILLRVRVLKRPWRPRLCSDEFTLTGQTIRAMESPLQPAAPVIRGL